MRCPRRCASDCTAGCPGWFPAFSERCGDHAQGDDTALPAAAPDLLRDILMCQRPARVSDEQGRELAFHGYGSDTLIPKSAAFVKYRLCIRGERIRGSGPNSMTDAAERRYKCTPQIKAGCSKKESLIRLLPHGLNDPADPGPLCAYPAALSRRTAQAG